MVKKQQDKNKNMAVADFFFVEIFIDQLID